MLSAAESQALFLSLKVASVAVSGALPFAVLTAFFLARMRFAGKIILDGFVHLPLILPPVVLGYLLLIGFGVKAPAGAWIYETFGHRFIFHWSGAALAAALVSFPFQVRAIRLALETAGRGQEQAAATLGAGPVDRFFSVTLPLAAPGIVSGVMMAFAASLGAFGAIITFASNIPGETRTLPLAIYTAIQTPGGDAMAARLAALSVALAFVALILAELAARRIGKGRSL